MTLYAGLEAGGTKFVCAVGDAAGSRETVRIATRDPDATITEVIGFFRAAAGRHEAIAALGIGSFGPLDLDPASPGYGSITTTPKPGWRDVPLLATLSQALGVPAAIDTDVNAAALAEARLGAGRGAGSIAYVTVGTGIGVGLWPRSGAGHPEAGHLLLRRHPLQDGFAGVCPWHGDCLEGLASGPAIQAAWGAPLSDLPADHPAFAVQADYVAQLIVALTLVAAPAHVVLGGGVMAQSALFPPIRDGVRRRLGGYVARFDDAAVLAARITPPGCAEPSGLVGAYLLAEGAAALRA